MTTPVPEQPKIYHITHVDNLENIVHDGYLHADSTRAQRQGDIVIGMDNIKIRRLSLPVSCCPDTKVGDYVPFNFCPRSIMLYVIHCANHSDLAYRGGQGGRSYILKPICTVSFGGRKRNCDVGRIPSLMQGVIMLSFIQIWIILMKLIGAQSLRGNGVSQTSGKRNKPNFSSNNRFHGALLSESAYTHKKSRIRYTVR